ncbi:MAG: tripartite tricarboxylate transporter substrate binding protein [Alphaproteobacteria bacterium]|nr:tripartite tricarboxylate transporter substrate binding protein [Alphaproteobacteria bacterium]
MISRRRMLIASAVTLAFAVPNGAFAQMPSDKPIKIVVAVAAGGPMDTMARFIAPLIQERLGQTVIVENRPGAGTTIASKAVAQAEPDGTTLLWGTLASVAIAPAMYKNLDYDAKAFVPVAMIAEFPLVMTVPASLPARDLKEFVAYARANKGKLSFGGSLGTPPQLIGVLFNKVADLGMTYVPYKGGAPSIADLIAGRIHMQFDAMSLLLPMVNDGKLRALAVTTQARWPRLPDVPTLREAGYAGLPGSPWGSLLAPPRTPAPVVARLNAAVNESLRTPAAVERLGKLNMLPRPVSPQEFAAILDKEIPIWSDVAKAAGLTAQ